MASYFCEYKCCIHVITDSHLSSFLWQVKKRRNRGIPAWEQTKKTTEARTKIQNNGYEHLLLVPLFGNNTSFSPLGNWKLKQSLGQFLVLWYTANVNDTKICTQVPASSIFQIRHDSSPKIQVFSLHLIPWCFQVSFQLVPQNSDQPNSVSVAFLRRILTERVRQFHVARKRQLIWKKKK